MKNDKKALKSVGVSNVGIKMDTPLLTIDGQPIKHASIDGVGTPATFRSIALESLLERINPEDKSGKQAFEAFRLSQKLSDADIIELTLDERTLIRNHVAARSYTTVVLGRMFEILDGKTNNAVLEE